jgi:hypothetical protein
MISVRTYGWSSLVIGCAVALCVAATSFAQERRMAGPEGHAWKASELIGLSVRTKGDEEKGKIKDLFVSPDGRVEYAAVSFGGFMGIGDKLFAVPIDAIHLEWKDNKVNHAVVDVTEETIKQRQGFEEKHWPEHADRGFVAVPVAH